MTSSQADPLERLRRHCIFCTACPYARSHSLRAVIGKQKIWDSQIDGRSPWPQQTFEEKLERTWLIQFETKKKWSKYQQLLRLIFLHLQVCSVSWNTQVSEGLIKPTLEARVFFATSQKPPTHMIPSQVSYFLMNTTLCLEHWVPGEMVSLRLDIDHFWAISQNAFTTFKMPRTFFFRSGTKNWHFARTRYLPKPECQCLKPLSSERSWRTDKNVASKERLQVMSSILLG